MAPPILQFSPIHNRNIQIFIGCWCSRIYSKHSIQKPQGTRSRETENVLFQQQWYKWWLKWNRDRYSGGQKRNIWSTGLSNRHCLPSSLYKANQENSIQWYFSAFSTEKTSPRGLNDHITPTLEWLYNDKRDIYCILGMGITKEHQSKWMKQGATINI